MVSTHDTGRLARFNAAFLQPCEPLWFLSPEYGNPLTHPCVVRIYCRNRLKPDKLYSILLEWPRRRASLPLGLIEEIDSNATISGVYIAPRQCQVSLHNKIRLDCRGC
jgi:hypothetical protein